MQRAEDSEKTEGKQIAKEKRAEPSVEERPAGQQIYSKHANYNNLTLMPMTSLKISQAFVQMCASAEIDVSHIKAFTDTAKAY